MGGPYMPKTAGMGLRPTITLDVPICAVFLALFLIGAVCHMTLFRRNLARGHKFIPSAMTFGFCMSRIVANAIRIAWACHVTNISLAIAAQIFVAAGVLLLFILNLLYAQRMFRAVYPGLGWSRAFSWAFKALYGLVVVTIIMVITCVVQSASFRAATSWMPPRPVTDPAWYHSKACFYVFDFAIDIMVVALFFVARVDRRFWVPNGSSKVRHYRKLEDFEKSTEMDVIENLESTPGTRTARPRDSKE
ncbi:unnamed protein product [Penicillium bialowiezense]